MSFTVAFSVHRTGNLVILYNETYCITQTQQIYRQTHQETPPSQHSMLKWEQSSPDHRSMEIQRRLERPSMIAEY